MARLVRPTVLKRDDYAADIERIGYSGIDCEEIQQAILRHSQKIAGFSRESNG